MSLFPLLWWRLAFQGKVVSKRLAGFFFLQHFEFIILVLCRILLSYKVSVEKSGDRLIWMPLNEMRFFLLLLLNIFYISENFIMMWVSEVLSGLYLYRDLWASCIWISGFPFSPPDLGSFQPLSLNNISGLSLALLLVILLKYEYCFMWICPIIHEGFLYFFLYF